MECGSVGARRRLAGGGQAALVQLFYSVLAQRDMSGAAFAWGVKDRTAGKELLIPPPFYYYFLTLLLTYCFTYLLTYFLTDLLTYSLTYLLTYLLTY